MCYPAVPYAPSSPRVPPKIKPPAQPAGGPYIPGLFPTPALPGSGSMGRHRLTTGALSARFPRAPRRYEVHRNHTALFQTSSRAYQDSPKVGELESWRVKSESRNPLTLQLFNFSALQLLSFH